MCIPHCEGNHLLISNAKPIDYAFYISLEATFALNLRLTPRNWCCYMTLPSIVDEDAKMMFYALDNSNDFKVDFCTPNFLLM